MSETTRSAGTPSAGPAIGPVLAAEFRLLLRSIATRGRLVCVGALSLMSLASAVLISSADPLDPFDAAVDYASFNLIWLIPVTVLVFGSATLGDLIDDGSLVYLWLRPVHPAVHVLAAWSATVAVTVPLVLAPVTLATVLLDAEAVPAAFLGGLVATVAYSALFVTLGIRFRRSLPWGLIYILIWEGFVALAGGTAAKLSIRYYVLSVVARITDEPIELATFSLTSGVLVPLAVAAAALVYGTRRLARTDVA